MTRAARAHRRWVSTALLAGLAGLAQLAGCSCSQQGAAPAATPPRTASATPNSSPTATATTQPPRRRPVSATPTGKRVLAVKLDNSRPARPQTALANADLIYIEPVEAGLSRICAVYSSRMPKVVGPVRSARESDIELLAQFGRPALAYSGAQGKLKPLLAKASFYDVSPSHAGSAYFRASGRAAPHNFYARTSGLLARAPKASKAKDIGFHLGAAPPGGKPRSSLQVAYTAFRIGFSWTKGGYAVSMDGRRVPSVRPATVVVQYTKIHKSRFHDRWGNFSPYTPTVGSGRAVVLRDGRAYDVKWSRPNAASGTTFTTADGRPMTFGRGQIWTVFARA
jgi:hypothetical protein